MRTHVQVVACLLIATSGTTARAEATSLVLLPPVSKLNGPRATQHLLVECVRDGVLVGEVRGDVEFSTSNAAVATVDASGEVHPVADGEATITARVFTSEELPESSRSSDPTAVTVNAKVIVCGMGSNTTPSFRNDVQPVLAKMGCNQGACHGALAGKGGFKLSLRGYDAEADYFSITRAVRGRRIEPTDPGRSLILAKPTMAVPHKGGLRFEVGSLAYEILAEWIASGAPAPADDDPRIAGLEVFPAEVTLRPGAKQRVVVRAKYTNGDERDVTRWARFTATNEAVSTVDEDGRITVTGHGVGAVSVWYGSKIATVRITSPYENEVPREVFAKAPRRNFIDELVLKQLEVLRLPPAKPADDATFLRRAFLDTIGKLPTPEEVRNFLADTAPDKRDRLIESLLEREEFIDYWAYQWSDLLLVNGTILHADAVKAFYSWIRERVATNTPWDEFAREIILAKGNSLDHGATNFYALHQDPESVTENISQAFLGLSIGCAKCHNHPLEKWTNDQYYAMANLLARVRAKGWGGGARNGDGVRIVYVESHGDLIQPSKGLPQPPAPLDGEPLDAANPADRREYLADWLTAPQNPYFGRAITNRIWANFFGVGLVEPVDDLRLSNPASNEALLDALTKFLVEHHYDLKALMRLILQSTTYQRSSLPELASRGDTRHYAHYYPRRLMAEVALDAISQVTGVPSEFTEIEFPGADIVKTEFYPKGTRAIELYDSAVLSRFLRTFGRHQRTVACVCDRSNEPSLVQALHLSNGETIRQKLAAKDGKVESIAKSNLPSYRIVEELYLSALSRYPSDVELERFLAVMNDASQDQRREIIEDVYWAVLSSREFLFQH